MPAPSKFTEARKQQILAVLKVGGSRKTAAEVAGVAEETLRVWLKRGQEVDDPDSAYTQFLEEVLGAEASERFRLLGIISKAAVDKPELAWKIIERREPGYAPPMPGKVVAGPQVNINLSLTGSGKPLPSWLEGEVIEGEVIEDAEEVPALSDGSSDPAEASRS